MEKLYYFIQITLTGIITWFSARLGILFPLLAIFAICMIIDCATGYGASAYEALKHPTDDAYGWNSKLGRMGIYKKFGKICVIAVAIVLDFTIKIGGERIGYEMPEVAMFGILVTVWYILNEMLSIIENAGRMDAHVPIWLTRYISVLKGKIDKKEESEE